LDLSAISRLRLRLDRVVVGQPSPLLPAGSRTVSALFEVIAEEAPAAGSCQEAVGWAAGEQLPGGGAPRRSARPGHDACAAFQRLMRQQRKERDALATPPLEQAGSSRGSSPGVPAMQPLPPPPPSAAGLLPAQLFGVEAHSRPPSDYYAASAFLDFASFLYVALFYQVGGVLSGRIRREQQGCAAMWMGQQSLGSPAPLAPTRLQTAGQPCPSGPHPPADRCDFNPGGPCLWVQVVMSGVRTLADITDEKQLPWVRQLCRLKRKM
jgi:hypothetical protein